MGKLYKTTAGDTRYRNNAGREAEAQKFLYGFQTKCPKCNNWLLILGANERQEPGALADCDLCHTSGVYLEDMP